MNKNFKRTRKFEELYVRLVDNQAIVFLRIQYIRVILLVIDFRIRAMLNKRKYNSYDV